MENRGLKLNYLLAPLGVLIVSIIGGYFTGSGMDWYNTLNKPGISPSGSFVGTAWTIIFILSAISILLFSNNPKTNRKSIFFKLVVLLFVFNGFLNVLWSALFFSWNLILISVVEMCVLNLVNLLLIFMLWRQDRASASLLIPYFLWVCFVTYLAYSIYLLN